MNTIILIKYTTGPFDPYPFVFLNLVLAGLAVIQAPIIMMSQNREAQKDRIKTEYDYQINKKAEEEIKEHEKKIQIEVEKNRKDEEEKKKLISKRLKKNIAKFNMKI